MRKFRDIEAVAAKRKGGPKALERLLDTPLPTAKLARIPASAWLEAMAKGCFQAGFNWQTIEAKWPAFKAAFEGFDVRRVAHYEDADIDRLLADTSIVRNGAKVAAVIDNARFLSRLDDESGGASRHLANWPVEDHCGLLALLADKGARLGGVTGQRVCRMIGRDGYILSPDVCKRLTQEGIIDRPPSSKAAMTAVQNAFNRWRSESGRPLTQISQVLAMSVD